MKKEYVEPELELERLRFDRALMTDLTLHSVTETGGTGGALSDDDDGEIIIP